MREILFRAKQRKNAKEWLYGYVSKRTDDKWYIDTVNEVYVEIDRSTICEYTGLRDVNNNRIFEKDIVTCFYPERYGIVHTLKGPVSMIEGCWFVTQSDKFYCASLHSNFERVERVVE